jgi:UrcA family protein
MTYERREAPNRRLVKRGSLFGVLLLCAGTALADPVNSQESGVSVHYSEIDLTRPQGATRLYRRIKVAARVACDQYDSIEPARREVYRRCYLTAVDEAVRKVGADTLTEIHLSQTQHETLR